MNKRCADLARLAKPFSEKQTKLLKEVADGKWNSLTRRVANIHEEVFEEIMETEMALARLETQNLGMT